ncbi:MAG: acetylxylan esterase [Deltaproteobacteria bacterium]|nr:MAG: acetylxylan esterase [Deltaproteobacteria bacterium]
MRTVLRTMLALGWSVVLGLGFVVACSSEPGTNNTNSNTNANNSSDAGTSSSSVDPAIQTCLASLPEVAKLSVSAELPLLLQTFCDQKEAKTPEEWRRRRRPEILGLFDHYVYGMAPQVPKDMKVEVEVSPKPELDGAAIRKIYRIQPDASSPVIELLVYIPTANTPAPLFLGLNFFGNHTTLDDPAIPLETSWVPDRAEGAEENRATEKSRGTSAGRWAIAQNIKAGFAVATLYHGDLDLDQPDGKNWVHERFGATEAIRNKPESGGTINAWAWGLSRALDVLVKDKDVDATNIWVMGHSRNGKAALLATARDSRFAGVISNQSGSMGAAVNRGKQGETIKTIQPFFPHWFHDRFAGFVEEPNRLPVDQHLLLALIAPRPLLVATATSDDWADPPSAWRSVVAAQPIWPFLGKPQPALKDYPKEKTLTGKDIAFHRRPGGHSVTPDDWAVFTQFAASHFSR